MTTRHVATVRIITSPADKIEYNRLADGRIVYHGEEKGRPTRGSALPHVAAPQALDQFLRAIIGPDWAAKFPGAITLQKELKEHGNR